MLQRLFISLRVYTSSQWNVWKWMVALGLCHCLWMVAVMILRFQAQQTGLQLLSELYVDNPAELSNPFSSFMSCFYSDFAIIKPKLLTIFFWFVFCLLFLSLICCSVKNVFVPVSCWFMGKSSYDDAKLPLLIQLRKMMAWIWHNL